MKKYISIILIVLLTACSMEVDENVAKERTSELLEIIKSHDFAKTNEYYSDEMNDSESVEDRKKKFEKIENAAGKILKYELISIERKNIHERKVLELTYKVTCSEITLNQIFIMAMDQGDCVVLSHNITN